MAISTSSNIELIAKKPQVTIAAVWATASLLEWRLINNCFDGIAVLTIIHATTIRQHDVDKVSTARALFKARNAHLMKAFISRGWHRQASYHQAATLASLIRRQVGDFKPHDASGKIISAVRETFN